VILRDPLEVTVGGEAEKPAITQYFYEVALGEKPVALANILAEHKPESSVVFCNTRRDTEDVVSALAGLGFSAAALHGEIDQRDRDEVLVRFANRSCQILVATDVAARGLDIKDLSAVVNYELPPDPNDYLHRIGRTGRMGKDGLALSLVTPREMPRAIALEGSQGIKLGWRKAGTLARPRNLGPAAMVTLCIDAGRTEKLRPGDILGALTGDAGLQAALIGKIDVFATRSYVAVAYKQAGEALSRLKAGKIKGRKLRVRQI